MFIYFLFTINIWVPSISTLNNITPSSLYIDPCNCVMSYYTHIPYWGIELFQFSSLVSWVHHMFQKELNCPYLVPHESTK